MLTLNNTYRKHDIENADVENRHEKNEIKRMLT